MQRRAFTLIELLVVISIIALLIGILLPALGAARRTARQLQNSTQLRGIQQAMVTFAQSNKSGGRDGYFPGLDEAGGYDNLSPVKAADIEAGSDVTAPTSGNMAIDYSMALLLDGNYFTPEYVLAPSDTDRSEFPSDGTADFTWGGSSSVDGNISYVTEVYSNDTMAQEWKESLNTQAIVLGDRAMNSGTPADIYSIWTDKNSGDWRGTLTHNDNSTSFEQDEAVDNLKYANSKTFDSSNVFGTVKTDFTTNADSGVLATTNGGNGN